MRKVRQRSKHPLLASRPAGHWYPDLVGVIPSYPKTEAAWRNKSEGMRKRIEAYNRAGKTHARSTTPKGYKGEQKRLGTLWQFATMSAQGIMQTIRERGIVTDQDDPRVQLALTHAIGLIEAKDPETGVFIEAGSTRVQAMRLLCDFLKSKPATKQDVNINTAEQWLASLRK